MLHADNISQSRASEYSCPDAASWHSGYRSPVDNEASLRGAIKRAIRRRSAKYDGDDIGDMMSVDHTLSDHQTISWMEMWRFRQTFYQMLRGERVRLAKRPC